MIRTFRVFFLLPFLFGGAGAHAQATGGSPSDKCLKFANGLSLGAQLPRTRAKLKAGKPVTVVALGSSSTTGFGTFRSDAAFPDVMKQELARLWPSAQVTLVNSGRIMDNIPGNVARLDSDVLRYKPDLVIWQLGSNDAVWRGIAENARSMIGEAEARLKAANADVVLVDLQYAPLVLVTSGHTRMEKIIAEVAQAKHVGHFQRFTLMKRAIDGGVKGLVWWDGLHNSVEGHRCIGIALGQMVAAAAR